MPNERHYFVLREDNCRFESMTKEQILSAITQAVETHTISDVDTGFITKIKEQNRNAALSFWIGTTAEYNAIEEKKQNCFYILTDDDTRDDFEETMCEIRESIISVSERVTNIENIPERGKLLASNDNGFETDTEYTAIGIQNYKLIAFVFDVECQFIEGGTEYTSENNSITAHIGFVPSNEYKASGTFVNQFVCNAFLEFEIGTDSITITEKSNTFLNHDDWIYNQLKVKAIYGIC